MYVRTRTYLLGWSGTVRYSIVQYGYGTTWYVRMFDCTGNLRSKFLYGSVPYYKIRTFFMDAYNIYVHRKLYLGTVPCTFI